MRRRPKARAAVELVVGVLAAAAAVWCWFAAQSVVTVAPVLPGEPQTTSVVFSPPLLVLMLLLATGAGVLAVDGIAHLRRVVDPAKLGALPEQAVGPPA